MMHIKQCYWDTARTHLPTRCPLNDGKKESGNFKERFREGFSWRRSTIETRGWVHPHMAEHLSDPFYHACLNPYSLSCPKTTFTNISPADPCPCTVGTVWLDVHANLQSTSISSASRPFHIKQSISQRFVQGNYTGSCPSISKCRRET